MRRNMKRYLIIFSLLLLKLSEVNAQSRASDLSLELLNTNRKNYYYGEPISIQLEIKNHSDEPMYIHRVSSGINIKYSLFNLKNGQIVGDSQRYWRLYKEDRERIENTVPSMPFLMGGGSFTMSKSLATVLYGSNLLTYLEGIKYKTTFIDQLTTIPVGRYKLVVEFFLLPGEESIKDEYLFEVNPLPVKEREAYEEYLKATVYATNSWAFGGRNYQSSSSPSYETFIANYPESIFVEYAYFNLAENVYYYGLPTTSKEDRVAFYESFVMKEFNKSNLVGKKAHRINSYLEFTKGVDKKKALDKMLIELQNFAPGLSDDVIEKSKKRQNIQGLQNRARQLD